MTSQAQYRVDARADEPDEVLPSLGEYLAYWAEVKADETALVYVDYEASRDGVRYEHTWKEYDHRATAMAARLSQICEPGDRVAILVNPSDEYAVAFHGILRAGLIAVPLFPPGLLGGHDRIGLVMSDCKAKALVTTSATREIVQGFLDSWLDNTHPTVVLSDEIKGARADELAASFVPPPPISHHDVAYLQYTSGSTRHPAGVMISHHNVIINARQQVDYHELNPELISAVSWLPLFHDMGLVLGVCCPVVFGGLSTMFDGLAFVQRPRRWLEHMSASPMPFTAAPNFAFDYTAKRVKDLEGLDLSKIGAFGNGAEPIYSETITKFLKAFESIGLREEHIQPIYGLAEATLFVSSPLMGEVPHLVDFDADELGLGRAVPAKEGGRVSQLCSIGHPGYQEMVIVEPDACTLCEDGNVGEIWVRGPNVSRGYWENEENTEATFRGVLVDDKTPDAGYWLRTGDLGIQLDGWFYITGRIKDLIIVDGRNVYPQDVERTVEHAHPAVGPHRTAAFSVPGNGTELVIVVAEQYRLAENVEEQILEITAAVKKAISAEHSVAVHDFVFVEQFSVPRTSSAKIARRATRKAYLEGKLPRIGPKPAGAPDA